MEGENVAELQIQAGHVDSGRNAVSDSSLSWKERYITQKQPAPSIYLGRVYRTYRQVGKRKINVSLQKTVRGTLNTQLLYLPAEGEKKVETPHGQPRHHCPYLYLTITRAWKSSLTCRRLVREVIPFVICDKELEGFTLSWTTDCFQANSPDMNVTVCLPPVPPRLAELENMLLLLLLLLGTFWQA